MIRLDTARMLSIKGGSAGFVSAMDYAALRVGATGNTPTGEVFAPDPEIHTIYARMYDRFEYSIEKRNASQNQKKTITSVSPGRSRVEILPDFSSFYALFAAILALS